MQDPDNENSSGRFPEDQTPSPTTSDRDIVCCSEFTSEPPGRAAMRVLVLLCLFLLPGFALAEEPTITVTVGDQTRTFTRGELPGAARCHYHPSGAGHHLSRAHDLPCRASRGPIRRNDSSARQRSRQSRLTVSSRNCRSTSCSIPTRARQSPGSRSSLRIIPGRQFWRKIRALARSTSFGPVLRSEAFAASNGRSKWRSW